MSKIQNKINKLVYNYAHKHKHTNIIQRIENVPAIGEKKVKSFVIIFFFSIKSLLNIEISNEYAHLHTRK